MDASGPWTASTLRLVADNPEVRAADLAESVGRDRDSFKTDVRKLKNLGLTESLLVGYRISLAASSTSTHCAAPPQRIVRGIVAHESDVCCEFDCATRSLAGVGAELAQRGRQCGAQAARLGLVEVQRLAVAVASLLFGHDEDARHRVVEDVGHADDP